MFKSRFYEKFPRSIVKTVTWRIIATITVFVNGYIASGSWQVGMGVAGIALIVNNALYFLHERTWNRLDWRRQLTDNIFVDRLPRSLTKLITWRVIATIALFTSGYLVTGSWQIGAGFAGLNLIVNSIAYFLHERAWNNLNWGKQIQ